MNRKPMAVFWSRAWLGWVAIVLGLSAIVTAQEPSAGGGTGSQEPSVGESRGGGGGPHGPGRGRGRRFRGGRGAGGGGRVERPAEGTNDPSQEKPTQTDEHAEHAAPGAEAGSGDEAQTRFQEDRELFHALLSRHTEIRRQVENLPDGVRTTTEADDPELVAKIRLHVARMKTRVEEPAPIHMRDPLFRELFRHADKIEMMVEEIEHGVRVVERSDDPYVAKLIQAHAAVVNRFVSEGHSEVRKNHEVPAREEPNPNESSQEGSGS